MENKKIIIFLLSISLFLPVLASAETILLKSGKTVDGKILERTDRYIKIDISDIPAIYSVDDIVSIDGRTIDITKQFPSGQTPVPSAANSASGRYIGSDIGTINGVTVRSDISATGQHMENVPASGSYIGNDPSTTGEYMGKEAVVGHYLGSDYVTGSYIGSDYSTTTGQYVGSDAVTGSYIGSDPSTVTGNSVSSGSN